MTTETVFEVGDFEKITLSNGREWFVLLPTIEGKNVKVVDGYGLLEVGVCFNCHILFYKEYPEHKFCCRDCWTRFRRKMKERET